MNIKLVNARARVIAAGLAAAGGLIAASPASAADAVPCSAAALTAALTSAVSGETLQLADSCRYVLTAALPAISGDLTIHGDDATLERSAAAGTPDFGILTMNSGNLAVSQLNFRNGANGAINYQSNSPDEVAGNITVTGGAFTANAGGAINNTGDMAGLLTVTGAAFTRNTGGAINIDSGHAGSASVTGATSPATPAAASPTPHPPAPLR